MTETTHKAGKERFQVDVNPSEEETIFLRHLRETRGWSKREIFRRAIEALMKQESGNR